MASTVIHMCVTNEINKILKRNEKDILIGTIAPDISKHINQSKEKSHFLDNVEDDIPNIEKFLKKYKNNLNDDFVMGYYIHLYTDYLWFKYFIPSFVTQDFIYTLDGNKVPLTEEDKLKYIYNDYTNLNIKLLDEYDLNLSIFYEEKNDFKDIIQEIPMDKIQIIIDNAGLIIKNTEKTKAFVFDLDEIKKFISFSIDEIIQNIKKYRND